MMTWNYRLIKHDEPNGDPWIAIHEVYYGNDGTPEGMTMMPVIVNGLDWDECYGKYLQMREAFSKPMIHADYFEQLARQRASQPDSVPTRPAGVPASTSKITEGDPNDAPQRTVPDTGTTNGRKD